MHHTYPTLHDRTAPHIDSPRRTTAGLLVSLTPLAGGALVVALAAAPLPTLAALALSTTLLALGGVALRRRRPAADANGAPGRRVTS